MKKKHLFLSYCRDDEKEVTNLRLDLIDAGEKVWWDKDILAGQDWKLEIRQALKEAYAVLLCLSDKTTNRIKTGIYPEALNAIKYYREYAPGSVYLIPVRLSECEIPPIEIDSTRTLDSLQFIDLFPPKRRPDEFTKLVKSLKNAPEHP